MRCNPHRQLLHLLGSAQQQLHHTRLHTLQHSLIIRVQFKKPLGLLERDVHRAPGWQLPSVPLLSLSHLGLNRD
jgi:hypothetical protein